MICLLSAVCLDSLHLGAKAQYGFLFFSSVTNSCCFLKDLRHSNIFFQKTVKLISDLFLDYKGKCNTDKILVFGWSCLDT